MWTIKSLNERIQDQLLTLRKEKSRFVIFLRFQSYLTPYNHRVLRIDHTYRTLKNVSVLRNPNDKKSRVRLKASRLTILNEEGHVLLVRIVPDDSHVHLRLALTEIWKTPGRQCTTDVVFTDNVQNDGRMIKVQYRCEQHFVTCDHILSYMTG